MSGARREGDFYPTPPKLARAIVKRLLADGWIGPMEPVLEPSAGRGGFVKALAEAGFDKINAIEPSLGLFHALEKLDLAKCEQSPIEEFIIGPLFAQNQQIVGNPPFSHAEAHVRLLYDTLPRFGVLAFLLPLPFLTSKKRMALWEDTDLAVVYILPERPSFSKTWTCRECGHKWTTGPDMKKQGRCCRCHDAGPHKTSSTDTQSYGVFVWRRGHPIPPQLKWLDWKAEK